MQSGYTPQVLHSNGTPTRRPIWKPEVPGPKDSARLDDLVPQDQRHIWMRLIPIDDVQICAANPAGLDANPDLLCAGNRFWYIAGNKLASGIFEHHCANLMYSLFQNAHRAGSKH